MLFSDILNLRSKVIKIILSCETEEQLLNTERWMETIYKNKLSLHADDSIITSNLITFFDGMQYILNYKFMHLNHE